MASLLKPRSTDLYGLLLHAYPRSFRQRYRPSMVQTFDDMLEDEVSFIGRSRIWTRTLLDLPRSATKERITDGKEVIMNRTVKLILLSAFLAVLIVGLGSYWLGNIHARQTGSVEQVTAAQLADAMQQDRFYSDYGNDTVLFDAKVSAVSTQATGTLVTFQTGRSYGLSCQFSQAATVKTGQTLSIAAPAGRADRQARGVLLHDCLVN